MMGRLDQLTIEQAMELPPSVLFKSDGCTCFPDCLPGGVKLSADCRLHDWMYYLARINGKRWGENETKMFRQWADAVFQMRLVYKLRRRYPRWLADTIAQGMWRAVRLFGRTAATPTMGLA
jgi:hypothetical protein